MNMRLTAEEIAAIRKLCPDSYVARDLLGEIPHDFPADWYEPTGTESTDYVQRLQAIVTGFRSHLLNMALELDEYPDGASDIQRLRSEGVGLLLALRDIYHQFPELSREPTVA